MASNSVRFCPHSYEGLPLGMLRLSQSACFNSAAQQLEQPRKRMRSGYTGDCCDVPVCSYGTTVRLLARRNTPGIALKTCCSACAASMR